MTAWVALACAGTVAYLMRLGAPLSSDRFAIPARAEELARLVAPAAIAALLASSLRSGAAGELTARDLVPLVVGLLVARRTESIPATLAAGVATYTAFGALP